MNLNKQNLINKIKYRAQYRGSKEMDKFVYSFVNNIINDLDFDQLNQLSKLIDLSDEKIIEISNSQKNNDISEKIYNLLINYKKKY